MNCVRADLGACSDAEPRWELVTGDHVEGPFCFSHALHDIMRAERAGAIRIPEMRTKS